MDAWNGFQILVDRADLVVRQVFEIRPWHDLEKVTIDGGHGRWVLRKAVCGNSRRAVWMKVVKILAGPDSQVLISRQTGQVQFQDSTSPVTAFIRSLPVRRMSGIGRGLLPFMRDAT